MVDFTGSTYFRKPSAPPSGYRICAAIPIVRKARLLLTLPVPGDPGVLPLDFR